MEEEEEAGKGALGLALRKRTRKRERAIKSQQIRFAKRGVPLNAKFELLGYCGTNNWLGYKGLFEAPSYVSCAADESLLQLLLCIGRRLDYWVATEPPGSLRPSQLSAATLLTSCRAAFCASQRYR